MADRAADRAVAVATVVVSAVDVPVAVVAGANADVPAADAVVMVDVAGVVAAVVVDGLGNATVGVVIGAFVAVDAADALLAYALLLMPLSWLMLLVLLQQ